MIAYYLSDVIGTGKDEDAYRPSVGDKGDIAKWEACYEQTEETRSIVRVYADESVLDALALTHELIYKESEL